MAGLKLQFSGPFGWSYCLYLKSKCKGQKKKTRSSASGDSGCIRSNPIVWSTSGSLAVGLEKKILFYSKSCVSIRMMCSASRQLTRKKRKREKGCRLLPNASASSFTFYFPLCTLYTPVTAQTRVFNDGRFFHLYS